MNEIVKAPTTTGRFARSSWRIANANQNPNINISIITEAPQDSRQGQTKGWGGGVSFGCESLALNAATTMKSQ